MTRFLNVLDKVLLVVCTAATVAAGLVLTYSVIVRHFLHWSTDWQDEAAVFLLVGATFLSAPFVQAVRGHIAIEALHGSFPPAVERVRLLLVDLISVSFCGTFAWQAALLLKDAVESGEVTDSSWAPPLWLPYGLMTVGMVLLTIRLVAQILPAVAGLFSAKA